MRPIRTAFRSRLARLALAVFVAGGAGFAFAHGGATGVVKERMELMKDVGKSMKTLTAMFKGETDYDAGQVKAAAARIRDHAGKITGLFPEGSLDKPTEALPEIWRDWPAFEALAERLAAYSGALIDAAENPGGAGMGTGPQAGQGMMGGQGQGMMMGQGQGMMTGQGRGMMGGGMMAQGGGPPPEMLAQMPPRAAFVHLAQTCNACHTRFRIKKE